MFTERFNEIVESNKINLKELAQFCQIKNTNVSNWRKGRNLPSLEVFVRICQYLDVSADYLLGLSNF